MTHIAPITRNSSAHADQGSRISDVKRLIIFYVRMLKAASVMMPYFDVILTTLLRVTACHPNARVRFECQCVN